MLPEERDAAYLLDMLRAARDIIEMSRGASRDTLDSAIVLRLAAERQLITIGEAARRVSDGLKLAHPEIPWPQIVGLRNVLVHQYDEIDEDLLWRTIVERVPELLTMLEPLVGRDGEDT